MIGNAGDVSRTLEARAHCAELHVANTGQHADYNMFYDVILMHCFFRFYSTVSRLDSHLQNMLKR